MIKTLTIKWDTLKGEITTQWGEGVTASDVIYMCEGAEGEAQYVLEEEEQGDDEE